MYEPDFTEIQKQLLTHYTLLKTTNVSPIVELVWGSGSYMCHLKTINIGVKFHSNPSYNFDFSVWIQVVD